MDEKTSALRQLEMRRRRRKMRRIKKLLHFVFITFIFVVIAVSVFGLYRYLNENTVKAGKIGKGNINLKTLDVPDYVKIDLIHQGDARSGKKLEAVNGIVIHYTGNPGTTAENNRDYFDKSTTEVCSHFVIGIDGKIIQCLPLDERSAASNERNRDTISIEVCHENEDGKFSQSAYDSLIKLSAWLCDNSGLDSKSVIRHYDVTGKKCPLYYVEHEKAWTDFLDDVDLELKKY